VLSLATGLLATLESGEVSRDRWASFQILERKLERPRISTPLLTASSRMLAKHFRAVSIWPVSRSDYT
jgi:hypothetical protein